MMDGLKLTLALFLLGFFGFLFVLLSESCARAARSRAEKKASELKAENAKLKKEKEIEKADPHDLAAMSSDPAGIDGAISGRKAEYRKESDRIVGDILSRNRKRDS